MDLIFLFHFIFPNFISADQSSDKWFTFADDDETEEGKKKIPSRIAKKLLGKINLIEKH